MRKNVKITAGTLGATAAAGALALGLVTVSGGGAPASAASIPAATGHPAAVHGHGSSAVTVLASVNGHNSETVSQVNTIISSHCYREVRTAHVYYTHSSTKGWVHLPAPRTTVTTSTHCYK